MHMWNINILFQQVDDHMNPYPVLDSASEDMRTSPVMTVGESTNNIMAPQCNTTTHMFVVTGNEVWMLQT